MKINVYSIFDTKTAAFMQPFFMSTHGSATRAFAEVVNDSTHMIGKSPEDFSLFRLAAFDDNTGIFLPMSDNEISKPEFICQALSLKKLTSSMQNKEKPVSEHSSVPEHGTEDSHGQVLPIPAFLTRQAD